MSALYCNTYAPRASFLDKLADCGTLNKYLGWLRTFVQEEMDEKHR